MNKVVIDGVVKENNIVLKEFRDGTVKLAEFTLCHSNTFSKPKSTYYFKVQSWGENALLARDILKRGVHVEIEGTLKQNQWKGKDGKFNSIILITCFKIRLLKKQVFGVKNEDDVAESKFLDAVEEEAQMELLLETEGEKVVPTTSYNYEVEDDDDDEVPF